MTTEVNEMDVTPMSTEEVLEATIGIVDELVKDVGDLRLRVLELENPDK